MTRFVRAPERLTVIAALTVAIALAYGAFDRLVYAKALQHRARLRAESVTAWHGLFVAEGQAARDAARHGSAAEDSVTLTADPVLTAHVSINSLARATGVHILSMSPGTPVRVTETLRTPLTMSVQGSYAQIVRFLARIERAPLLTQLSGVTISAGDGGGSTLNAELALLMITVPREKPQE